jgi:hypothetical protein
LFKRANPRSGGGRKRAKERGVEFTQAKAGWSGPITMVQQPSVASNDCRVRPPDERETALPQHLAHAELMRASWLSHLGLKSCDNIVYHCCTPNTFIDRPRKIRPIDRRD